MLMNSIQISGLMRYRVHPRNTRKYSIVLILGEPFDSDGISRTEKAVWDQFKLPNEDRLEEDRQRRVKVQWG